VAESPLSPVVNYLRAAARGPGESALSDAELLQRYASRRDEAAFEALVWRHGPMVLGLCRRLLRHAHDADDAFQAAFLALVRKARSIGKREAVASWLYKVAYRVALRARADAARRAAVERHVEELPAVTAPPDPAWLELLPLLDEAITELPEKYRTPLVLCYLEGKTNQEAAEELGWPTGTLFTRLARARDLLRAKLVRRGVGVACGVLATAPAVGVLSAAVPLTLMRVTVTAGLQFGAPAATVAAASAHVVALAKGGLQAMFLAKMKAAALWLAAVGVIGTGGGFVAHHALADRPAGGQATVTARPQPQEGNAAPQQPDAKGVPKEPVRQQPSATQDQDVVTSVAFSPDGRLVAVGGRDMVIELRQTGNGAEVLSIRAQQATPTALAFSPDGRVLISAGEANALRMWDVATGKEIRQFVVKAVAAFAFSPDGKVLASAGGDKTVRLWDIASGRLLAATQGEGEIASVAFSPDGRRVVAGGKDKAVVLLEVPRGVVTARMTGHTEPVNAVAFSPDGRYVVTGSADRKLILWDATTGQPVRRLARHRGPVLAVAFSPDGKKLVSGGQDGMVVLWDVGTGKALGRLTRQPGPASAVAFSPDGKKVAAAGADATRLLWDVAQLRPIAPPEHVNLSPTELEALWAVLAQGDNAAADDAITTLIAGARHSVPFLKERLPAEKAPAEARRIADFIKELDSPRFAEREKATAGLLKLGRVALPALRNALEANPNEEVRRRVLQVLDKIGKGELTREQTRALRVLEVLEEVGTPEARQVVEALADGAPEAWLTHEARAVLKRLKAEGPDTP
jgi:RNA polymerase sigma factor (sigma-70 family)